MSCTRSGRGGLGPGDYDARPENYGPRLYRTARKQECPRARSEAALGLAQLGPQAEPAVAALAKLLKDRWARRAAETALEEDSGPRRADPRGIARCQRPADARHAAEVLKKIGPAAVAPLIQLLEEKGARVRGSPPRRWRCWVRWRRPRFPASRNSQGQGLRSSLGRRRSVEGDRSRREGHRHVPALVECSRTKTKMFGWPRRGLCEKWARRPRPPFIACRTAQGRKLGNSPGGRDGPGEHGARGEERCPRAGEIVEGS